MTALLSDAVNEEIETVRDEDVDGIEKAVTVGAVVSRGVTGLDADEAKPSPIELVALTVNVYEVPLVRPVTVQPVVGGDARVGSFLGGRGLLVC